jgi:hypothetical protein
MKDVMMHGVEDLNMYNDESFDAIFNKANDDIQNHSFGYKDGRLQIELFHLHRLKSHLNDAKVLRIGRRRWCGRKCDILNKWNYNC